MSIINNVDKMLIMSIDNNGLNLSLINTDDIVSNVINKVDITVLNYVHY